MTSGDKKIKVQEDDLKAVEHRISDKRKAPTDCHNPEFARCLRERDENPADYQMLNFDRLRAMS